MTSLIKEVSVTSFEDFIFLCQGDDISPTFEYNLIIQPCTNKAHGIYIESSKRERFHSFR